MAFTNLISRNIDVDVLNFGFSGNGLMELGVAEWLVQVSLGKNSILFGM